MVFRWIRIRLVGSVGELLGNVCDDQLRGLFWPEVVRTFVVWETVRLSGAGFLWFAVVAWILGYGWSEMSRIRGEV